MDDSDPGRRRTADAAWNMSRARTVQLAYSGVLPAPSSLLQGHNAKFTSHTTRPQPHGRTRVDLSRAVRFAHYFTAGHQLRNDAYE